jgi:hypothetical protein
MKKNIFFSILALVFLTSCNNKQTEKQVVITKVVNEERLCLIDSVFENDDKIFASLDLIELSKMDSVLDGQQIIQLPNGFCYVNKNVKLEKIEINLDATIKMQTASFDAEGNFNFNEAFTINRLVELYSDRENERMKFVPFRIKIANNRISTINEIYIP